MNAVRWQWSASSRLFQVRWSNRLGNKFVNKWSLAHYFPSTQPKACDTSRCDFENIFSQSQIVEIPTFQEITVEQEIPEVGLQVEKTHQSKDSLGKNIHKPRLWVFARWQRSEFRILTYLTGRAWCVSWGASRQQGGWGMGVWRHCM